MTSSDNSRSRDRILSALMVTLLLHVIGLAVLGLVKMPEYQAPKTLPAVKVDLGPSRSRPNPTPAPAETTNPAPPAAPEKTPPTPAPAQPSAQKPTPATPSNPAADRKPGRSQPAETLSPAAASPKPAQTTPAPVAAVPTPAAAPAAKPVTAPIEAPPVVFQLPVPKPVTASSRDNKPAAALDLGDLGDLGGEDSGPARTGQATPADARPTALESGSLRFSGQMAGRGPLSTDPPDFTGMTPGKILVDFKVDASGMVIPGSIKFRADPVREIPFDVQLSLRSAIRDWTFTPSPDPSAPLVAGQITFTIVRK